MTSNYTRDGWIFFSLCCNFSNARVHKPWRKHKEPKVSDIENKLQGDKSKVKEKIDKNVITPKNWSDQWHATKFICRGPIRELIVQLRGRGMFFNSF